QLLNLARVNFGDELDVTVNDKSLTVTIPEHVIAGQLAFQVSDSELSVTLPEEKTGDVILLSHTEAGLLQSVMDFAYFNKDGERNFVLPLEYGRHSSTLTLSFALYGKDGVVTGQGIKTIDITPVPVDFSLDQNYPNPFNPTTQIQFGLPDESEIGLTVYDVLGRQVRNLISSAMTDAGFHNIVWDARDNAGAPVSAGLYFYQLTARGVDGTAFSKTRKMLLLK
ncbi:MAG: FlgD immunoglobulin-like domain containing protein, partial [Candidatus Marinimicrobia bacterium]|nr:FlgD immunoglobulin-like domain containing protein [Candidatus Neomarinimicrobiota bacterium]